DRPGELTEHARALTLVLGPLDRLGQLADHRVHPRLELADRLSDLVLASALANPEDEQRQEQRCERCTDGGEGDRHRHSLTISLLSLISAVSREPGRRCGFVSTVIGILRPCLKRS